MVLRRMINQRHIAQIAEDTKVISRLNDEVILLKEENADFKQLLEKEKPS